MFVAFFCFQVGQTLLKNIFNDNENFYLDKYKSLCQKLIGASMSDSHVCHIVCQKVIYSILNTSVVILCQKVVSCIFQQMIAGIWTVVN